MESPCVDHCTMHPEAGLCEGCGRTIAEIAAWSAMSDDERRHIMTTLPERMRRAGLVQRRAR